MSAILKGFLASINLEDHYEAFNSNGIDMDVLGDLTSDELAELGLNLGDRKRLIKAAKQFGTADIGGRVSGPERRQLTVMFIDLVGSTALSAAHDVEDFRTIMSAYQSICKTTIEKHGGTIAKYMGDGILAYFGYPSTSEDSAERAARCGLELIKEVQGLAPLPGVHVSCRVAAATGMVIVGDLIGSGESQERQVVGDTPNLAGRLQALAKPNQMVVADTTYNLTKGLFDFRKRGPNELKGFLQPVTYYEVVGEREIESRFRATREGRALSTLCGRDAELAVLLEQWEACQSGHLELGLLEADAGIGKSRLLAELVQRVGIQQDQVVEFACQPQFKNSPMRPLRSFVETLCGWSRSDDPNAQFEKLGSFLNAHDIASELAVFASTLGLPPMGLYEPPSEAPQVQRTKVMQALAQVLAKRAQAKPLLILFEDLHWADATTLEVLQVMLDGLDQANALFLATTRPDKDLPLSSNPKVRIQRLKGLDDHAATTLTQVLADGRTLSPELTSHILAQAEGNPLFLEELTKSLIESDAVNEEHGVIRVKEQYVKSAIPTTLQDSLMARLDRVSSAKEFAQIGAVIGREFSLDLLSDVSAQPTDTVVSNLADLEKAELIFPIEGRQDKAWMFKHALIQEAAYDSLLRSRRRELHGSVAQSYEKIRPEETVSQPEVIAYHLGEAGQFANAIQFGLSAGMNSLIRSANSDAGAHGQNCLRWVRNIAPGEDRDHLELKIHAILTPALMQSQGYTSSELQDSANRALELLETYGNLPEVFPNLWGLNLYHHVRSERQEARKTAERFVDLAKQIDDGSQLVAGLPIIGQCSWIEGNLPEAEADLRKGIELYDLDAHGMHGAMYGVDSLSYSLITLSQVLWMTGRLTEAQATADKALAHAQTIKHSNTTGMALLYKVMLKQQNGLREDVKEEVAAALDYCARMGVSTPTSYIAMIGNWAHKDVPASQEIYEIHNMVGAQLGMTFYRSLGAENAIELGDRETARAILDPALQQAREAGEGYWLPQLLRLQARIEEKPGTALTCLTEAVASAKASGAFLLEAMAIVDLLSIPQVDGREEWLKRLDSLIASHGVELPEFMKVRLQRFEVQTT